MERVLEHYGLMDKFKRGTDSLNGPCPIHKGSNPTQFRVSISKNIWNCFSECKHGGNVLDFIVHMENVSIHAAALKAIEWFSLNAEEMSASENKEEPDDTAPAPKPKKPAPPAEKGVPNTPLKFRLDKLEREHPYLTQERGLIRIENGRMRDSQFTRHLWTRLFRLFAKLPGEFRQIRLRQELFFSHGAMIDKDMRISVEEVIFEARNLYEHWPKLDVDRKRAIVESIFEKVEIGEGKINITYSGLPSSEELCKSQQQMAPATC
jgi:hypothetical protein